MFDPADAALLDDVLAATAEPFADPVVVRGVTMPRALARRIEAPLLRLRTIDRREHAARASGVEVFNHHGRVK